MNIHKTIRQIRESKHWSQEKMAGKLHMSPNGYAKIERGETRLYIDKLQQIAQVLDVGLFELMAFGESCDGVNPTLVSEINELKLIISHKEELLEQKQSEINTLKEMVALLKAPADHL